MEPTVPVWNSLEIAKLIVAVLTPLTVIGVGFWLNKYLKRLEHLQWANQKIIEKRISVYEELAPSLNDLLCYFTYVGCWKELEPTEVVSLKRKLDKIAYVNSPLFSEEFSELYSEFIQSCFQTYNDWGQDAKLLTAFQRRKVAAGSNWKREWERCFADTDVCPSPQDIQDRYREFMCFFASELNLGLNTKDIPTGYVPMNVK